MSKAFDKAKNNSSSPYLSPKNKGQGRGPAGGQRYLASEQEDLPMERMAAPAAGRQSGFLAGNIAVSQPNDRGEREAERHANSMVRGNSVQISAGGNSGFNLQRMCASCDDERKKRGGQGREKGSSESTQSNSFNSTAQAGHYASTLSGGEPLSSSSRAFFEPKLGRDLSQVRIHRDSNAAHASDSLQAKAFTYGTHIAFSKGAYAPQSSIGKHLLAHELTHVAQQGEGVARSIQRELATPLPDVAPEAQTDLTDAQIQNAIQFNRNRFDDTHTRQIQDIVGTEQTGTFNEADIRAIAGHQERYGLTKDGKVGDNTYTWLITEIQNEALDINNENCPVAFWIDRGAENIVPRANGVQMNRPFTMNANFPSYCHCENYQYRQFIRGHFNHTQGATTHDMRSWLANEPSGTLTRAFTEDGNNTVPSVFFGHRNLASAPDDRYLSPNRATGCQYRGSDNPGGDYTGFQSVGGVNVNPATGDRIDILIQFRGEIRLNGTTIITKFWTALQRNFVLP